MSGVIPFAARALLYAALCNGGEGVLRIGGGLHIVGAVTVHRLKSGFGIALLRLNARRGNRVFGFLIRFHAVITSFSFYFPPGAGNYENLLFPGRCAIIEKGFFTAFLRNHTPNGMCFMDITLKQIAHIKSDFPSKFGIPRQSGITEELCSTVVFEPEYRNPDALRGIEGFTHLWLIWEFSENVREEWSPTVRPPRLGGNERLGVFATRSPFRPNPIGLSCVKLLGVEKTARWGTVLRVGGADLMDGTPILDIKPYLPYTDAHPEAEGGFAAPLESKALQVVFPEALEKRVPAAKRKALRIVLSQDPRPGYQHDPERVYGFPFAETEVHFTVQGDVLTVTDVTALNEKPCYTYIVRCADNTYYTGWTDNLEKRMAAHNGTGGARYTRSRQPVTLVYSECFATKQEAQRREVQIKRLKRAEKEKLIQSKAKGI